MPILLRRLPLLVPMLLVAAAACSDSTEPEPEPEVATMRLIIGGTDTVTVAENGAVTGGPITIDATTSIAAEWLRDDGTPDPIVDGATFELAVVVANTGIVTFTRTGAFAGTLTKVAAGTTSATFGLLHVDEGHEDFGPFPVSIVVN
jgi:hypothetical protein